MPRYFPKKESQTETQFEIETSTNKYLLTIRSSSTSNSDLIYIGGVSTYCIECQIYKDKDEHIAHLHKIEYNESCALTGKFKRGSDTLNILYILCSFIQINYPHVYYLQFDDYSYRECDHKQTVDLASFNYLLHGKTWYMNKLGATFLHKKDFDYFTEADTQFQTLKSVIPWNSYDSYVTSSHPLPEIEMKRIYNLSKTWIEFFNMLLMHEDIDISKLCIYMAPWVHTFVNRIAKLNFKTIQFVLPIVGNSKITNIPYTLKSFNYSAGGGGISKYTRKKCKKYCLDLH